MMEITTYSLGLEIPHTHLDQVWKLHGRSEGSHAGFRELQTLEVNNLA